MPTSHWEALGSMVLQAAYEATMLAAVLNANRNASNIVLLTELGGGAFGNHPDWINAAIRRALALASEFAVDVRLVARDRPSSAIQKIAKDFS